MERDIAVPLSTAIVQSYVEFVKEAVPTGSPVSVAINCVERVGKDGDGHYKLIMQGLSVGKVQRMFNRLVIEHSRFNIPDPGSIGFMMGKGSCRLEELRENPGVFSVRLVQNRFHDSRNGEPAAWISLIGTREACERCMRQLSENLSYFDKIQTRNHWDKRKMSCGNNSTAISDE